MSSYQWPHVTTSPQHRFGRPRIGPIDVDAVADTTWIEGVEAATTAYDLTRAEALTAAWHVGSYGTGCGSGRMGVVGNTRRWRQRWGAWAADAGAAMWRGDYPDTIPDPPGMP